MRDGEQRVLLFITRASNIAEEQADADDDEWKAAVARQASESDVADNEGR